jgi:plasmid stability protein
MPAVHVRNLDDAVIDALKRRAAAHHRSLEGELRQILEEAAASERPAARRGRRRLRLSTVAIGRPGSFGRDEIYADGER